MGFDALLADVQVGYYISLGRCITLLAVLFVWGRLVTWIDKDSARAFLPRVPLNIALLSIGVFGFFLFFMVPGFWAAFSLLTLVVLGEAGAYLGMRNAKVGLKDLQREIIKSIKSFGRKGEAAAPKAGRIVLLDKMAMAVRAQADDDANRLAYDVIQESLTLPLKQGCERVEVAPVEGMAMIRYWVDGVPYNMPEVRGAHAAEAITYLKGLIGMDVNEKRKPQTAPLRVMMETQRKDLQVRTAGSSAGESLRVLVEPKRRYELSLEQLGMPPAQMEVCRKSVREGSGITLVAAPRGQGLTCLQYALLRTHDAFLSHIHTIERAPEVDLEGITQKNLAAGASPVEELKITSWVVSQQPDIVMIGEIENPATARELLKLSAEGKRVYVGLRAGSAFDAINQWRKLIGDDALALQNLSFVVAGRLVRKLCMACKIGYTPDPSTLKKMNMDPAKVGTLFQAREQPLLDAKGRPIPCEFCHELHFKGRTGIYELFTVDEEVRQIFRTGGSSNPLKAAFRKQKGRYLQEQGLALVESGETSVQEVLRVLRLSENS